MDNNYNKINNINLQNIDQKILNAYINEGIEEINKLKDILKFKTFDDLKKEADTIISKYNGIDYDEIDLSLLGDNSFHEKHYLLSLKSFFTYLITIICQLITELIEVNNNSKLNLDITKKEIITKNILTNILNKLDLFKD